MLLPVLYTFRLLIDKQAEYFIVPSRMKAARLTERRPFSLPLPFHNAHPQKGEES